MWPRARAAGRAVARRGSLLILNALKDRPARWTEIQEATGLQSMTLNRALKTLEAIGLIAAKPISTPRKGTEAYELLPVGRDLFEILLTLESDAVPGIVEAAVNGLSTARTKD